jgi:hypothetical protein
MCEWDWQVSADRLSPCVWKPGTPSYVRVFLRTHRRTPWWPSAPLENGVRWDRDGDFNRTFTLYSVFVCCDFFMNFYFIYKFLKAKKWSFPHSMYHLEALSGKCAQQQTISTVHVCDVHIETFALLIHSKIKTCWIKD